MGEHTPLPLPVELVPGNDNHGPYIVNSWGRDICDFYTMSNVRNFAVCNGGDSKPVWFDDAAQWAEYFVRAVNSHDALVKALEQLDAVLDFSEPGSDDKPMCFEDWTDLNAAFEIARAALAAASTKPV